MAHAAPARIECVAPWRRLTVYATKHYRRGAELAAKPPLGCPISVPKVHVIIPTHNRQALVDECLARIFAQTAINTMTVTVVDDGSTDGTAGMLAEKFPAVRVLQGDGTLWWTGAVAKALDTLRPDFARGDFFLLVNDDTLLCSGAVAALAHVSEVNGRAGVAPVAVDAASGRATGWGLPVTPRLAARSDRSRRGQERSQTQQRVGALLELTLGAALGQGQRGLGQRADEHATEQRSLYGVGPERQRAQQLTRGLHDRRVRPAALAEHGWRVDQHYALEVSS